MIFGRRQEPGRQGRSPYRASYGFESDYSPSRGGSSQWSRNSRENERENDDYRRRSRHDFNYQFDRDPTAFDSAQKQRANEDRRGRYYQGRATSGFEDNINNEPQSYRQNRQEQSYWSPSHINTTWDDSGRGIYQSQYDYGSANRPGSYQGHGIDIGPNYGPTSGSDWGRYENSSPRSNHLSRNQEFGRYEGVGATDHYEGLSTGISGPYRDETRSGRSDYQPSYVGKGPKGYRRPDDRIQDDVCYSLMQSPFVDASQVEVQVNQGVVTLTGTVPDRKMKRLAEDAIDHVQGVSDVHNQIKIAES